MRVAYGARAAVDQASRVVYILRRGFLRFQEDFLFFTWEMWRGLGFPPYE